MINPYSVIVSLFALAGLITVIWSWRNIKQQKQTLSWPSAKAKIIHEDNVDHNDSPFKTIKLEYVIDGKTYHYEIEVMQDDSSIVVENSATIDTYPEGDIIEIFYNPENPDKTTLEPGVARDERLIFIIGAGALILGLFFLVTQLMR